MRRLPVIMISAVGLLFAGFVLLGAAPNQAERPPQPFFQDFFSGSVLILGSPPPEATLLIACIDDCDSGFESAPYSLKADGTFNQLEVNPDNEDLVGHTITFYLVNEHGRIRAVESRPYIAVFDFYVQDLTFVDPMPLPPPPPPLLPDPTPTPEPTPERTLEPPPMASLPVAGDPSVARLPKIALMVGAVAVLIGAGLIFGARRGLA